MANKIVVDTHALIWYLENNAKLGASAKAVLDDPTSDLVLPIIALAEAMFIVERGKTKVTSVALLLDRLRKDPRIEIYPLTIAIMTQTLAFSTIPEMHDRQIAATALYLQKLGNTVSLLTKDSAIVASSTIPVIW